MATQLLETPHGVYVTRFYLGGAWGVAYQVTWGIDREQKAIFFDEITARRYAEDMETIKAEEV